jgi:hypothetical protein
MQRDTPPPRQADAPLQDLPQLGWLPRFARAFMRWVLRRVFRFEIEGLEHIPRGRYIVSANHPAYLETFTLTAFLPADRGLRVLASRTATVDIPWRRWLLDRVDLVLPVDLEGRESRASIRAAVDQLRAGGSIAIFPEDIRERAAPDASLRPLRRGVALLARSSQRISSEKATSSPATSAMTPRRRGQPEPNRRIRTNEPTRSAPRVRLRTIGARARVLAEPPPNSMTPTPSSQVVQRATSGSTTGAIRPLGSRKRRKRPAALTATSLECRACRHPSKEPREPSPVAPRRQGLG